MLRAERHLKDSSLSVALNDIWLQRWRQIEQERRGAALGDQTESLHQFRVALRCIRALLRSFKEVVPAAEAQYFTAEFKWLAAATGRVRDIDVVLADVRAWADAQAADTACVLTPAVLELARARELAQQQLRRVLASRRYQRLAKQWLTFVAALPQQSMLSDVARSPAHDWVSLKVARQSLNLLRRGSIVQHAPRPRNMHRLRIRGKRLRYLLESFEPLFGSRKRYHHFHEVLKELQQQLGIYHDCDGALTYAAALIKRHRSMPLLLTLLDRWQNDLRERKRLASTRFSAAFATFDKACRHLPR